MTTKEAEADRTTIANFIKGQPEEWIAPSGSLTGFECLERMSFAEKYATPKFRGWLRRKGSTWRTSWSHMRTSTAWSLPDC